MKLGRTFGGVRAGPRRRRPARRGLVRRARHHRPAARPPAGRRRPGRRCRTSRSRCCPSRVHERPAPTGRRRLADAAPDRSPTGGSARSSWSGSARPGRDWLTPQAQAALAAADDLVGYGPYLDRVPPNPRQRRHASDNRVEAERAALALDLARPGRRVAVVSSGDPGVFAMATAVLEVAAEPQWTRRPGAGAAGADRRAGGGEPGRRAARATTTACCRCPTGSSRGTVVAERLTAAAARRPGHRDLQPGVEEPDLAGRARPATCCWSTASPDTPVVVGRDVGGPERAGTGGPRSPTSTRPRSTCVRC